MEKIKIGTIVNAVGIKGELRVYNYSDGVDIYQNTENLFMDDELFKVEKARLQKNMVVLKLEGINDRNAAESCKGRDLFIDEEDLPELPEGEFYIRELIGMTVKEENGNVLGKVSNVIQNAAQDILEVTRDEGKNVLIPYVDQFIVDIDGDLEEITVSLIEGLLDL